MEQIKILEIINRWGYLNTEQIALLLNKNNATVDTLIRILNNKKLLRVDQLTRKNIYMLSSLGNRKLGKKSKSIRINYNELKHQDLLIKWLCQQNDIISYQTEKELKAESYREKGYPDLLVHYENKIMIIEFERTRKTKQRMRQKFDGLRHYCKSGYEVLFLVPNESMKKFVDEQIKIYNWKIAIFKTQIFNFEII
ncbi:BlaI/MecI/CopY family transcriptional regulator [Spiroplasma ixodetis]|uniref:Uncharacterized protein n=1 Tax=Spiroplasma ixodetis TaxID=2141 RepID=A0ABM8BZF9_9MOLU|nr:BlaI/MecI/CopY family transcriptional regulator [Spiroplasma ixodetis]BDT05202.1 hypothetical protein SHM_28480 [Spiroplasma ixodetis]